MEGVREGRGLGAPGGKFRNRHWRAGPESAQRPRHPSPIRQKTSVGFYSCGRRVWGGGRLGIDFSRESGEGKNYPRKNYPRLTLGGQVYKKAKRAGRTTFYSKPFRVVFWWVAEKTKRE